MKKKIKQIVDDLRVIRKIVAKGIAIYLIKRKEKFGKKNV
mgnify:CR=1 FL=1|jgi:hypothetical protein|tara:strand:+ start:111 stop:230 length:120 start_codon:yes stop_codon:yes gene_type:complete